MPESVQVLEAERELGDDRESKAPSCLLSRADSDPAGQREIVRRSN